jgi:hypothetical protein
MKLIEMQKCPICGQMRCDKAHTDDPSVCPICRHHPCECNSEQEEVEYKGKKISVGKHSDESDTRFDYDELHMGIEDEMKHTGDEKTAKAIAKDHLLQFPKYYSNRRKMKMESFSGFLITENTMDGIQHEIFAALKYKAKQSDEFAEAVSKWLTQSAYTWARLTLKYPKYRQLGQDDTKRMKLNASERADIDVERVLDGRLDQIHAHIAYMKNIRKPTYGTAVFYEAYLESLCKLLSEQTPVIQKYLAGLKQAGLAAAKGDMSDDREDINNGEW